MTKPAQALIGPTASSTSFRFMHKALQDFGVSASELYREIGLGADFLEDPARRVPIEAFERYWAAIEQKVATESIGLLLAENAQIQPINAPMMMLQASNTFGDGLARFIHFRQIMDPLYEWHLQVEGATARFYFDLKHSMIRQRMECVAVYLFRFFKLATDGQWAPQKVCFMHAQPRDISDHQRIFGCDLVFNTPAYSFEFAAELLNHTLFTRSPEICEYSEKLAAIQLENVTDSGLITRVKNTLVSILEFGDVSLEKVAAQMGVDSSDLQANLRTTGTHFNDVLDQVRKDIAVKMLVEGTDTLDEIAYITGYSALPNFYRAFRRWFGITPAQYREQHQAEGLKLR